MPNQRAPGTQRRSVAMPDELWDRIATHADATGTTASQVIRDAVTAYLEPSKEPQPCTTSSSPSPS